MFAYNLHCFTSYPANSSHPGVIPGFSRQILHLGGGHLILAAGVASTFPNLSGLREDYLAEIKIPAPASRSLGYKAKDPLDGIVVF